MTAAEVEMMLFEWAFTLIGLLLSGLIALLVHIYRKDQKWVREKFDQNDEEHERTYQAILRLHKRMDKLVPDRMYDGPKPEET